MRSTLNDIFDTLPRKHLRRGSQRVPALRACGIIGFQLALCVCLGTALFTGRSWIAALALATICALSFFVYIFLRRLITGKTELVLLESVWFAFLCCGIFLYFNQLPVLEHLDLVSVSMPIFLGMGRIGCLIGGCCHGLPSHWGICYSEHIPAPMGSSWRAGIRLAPVQAYEAFSLFLIAATGLLMLLSAPVGSASIWFCLAYAIVRFNLEPLRGDVRPSWLGISQAQWMVLTQVSLLLGWSTYNSAPSRPLFASATLLVTAALVALLATFLRSFGSRISKKRVSELREAMKDSIALLESTDYRANSALRVGTPQLLSRQEILTVTLDSEHTPETAHLAVRCSPAERLDELCHLVSQALPEVIAESVVLTESGVLHLQVPRCSLNLSIEDKKSTNKALLRTRTHRLFGLALRSQALGELASEAPDDSSADQPGTSSGHSAGASARRRLELTLPSRPSTSRP